VAAVVGLLEERGPHLPFPLFVPRADDLYDEHLQILEDEGLI
jgi:hypothetical protein